MELQRFIDEDVIVSNYYSANFIDGGFMMIVRIVVNSVSGNI